MNSEATQVSPEASKKVRTGTVISNKMQKTVIVEVTRRVRHGKYMKFIKRRLRYAAHDAESKCQVGDTVTIEETRPMSKTKRWRVLEIVQRGTGV